MIVTTVRNAMLTSPLTFLFLFDDCWSHIVFCLVSSTQVAPHGTVCVPKCAHFVHQFQIPAMSK